MKDRLTTGLFLGLIITAIFLLRFITPYIFDAFILLILVMASLEVCGVLRNKTRVSKILAILYPILYSAITIVGIVLKWPLLNILLYEVCFLALSMLVVFVTGMIINRKTYLMKTNARLSLKNTLIHTFNMVYPTHLLGLLYVLNHLNLFVLNESLQELGSNLGLIALIFVFLTTIITDTMAFFVGKKFKGKKLAPSISPNKTISGSVGGVISCVILSIVLFIVFSLFAEIGAAFLDAKISIYSFLIVGFLVSIFSQMGDLFASLVKRKTDAKDYSNIFAGHGGIMDRFDGESFSVPFIVLVCLIFLI